MMRLIDALPLEKTIIEWQTAETIEPLTKTIVDNVGTIITHAPTIEAIPIEWIMEYPDKLIEEIEMILDLDLAQHIKIHQDLLFYKTQLRIMVERWKEENE